MPSVWEMLECDPQAHTHMVHDRINGYSCIYTAAHRTRSITTHWARSTDQGAQRGCRFSPHHHPIPPFSPVFAAAVWSNGQMGDQNPVADPCSSVASLHSIGSDQWREFERECGGQEVLLKMGVMALGRARNGTTIIPAPSPGPVQSAKQVLQTRLHYHFACISKWCVCVSVGVRRSGLPRPVSGPAGPGERASRSR